MVKEASTAALRRLYEQIPLKLVLLPPTDGEKEQLAKLIGREWDRRETYLFPTLGSITMAEPLIAMRQRFETLSHEQKDTLLALKLMAMGGVIPFTEIRLRAVLKSVSSRQIPHLRDCLEDLAEQAFLRRPVDKDNIMVEPAYLMGAIDHTDARQPRDQFSELANALEELEDVHGLIALAITFGMTLGLNDQAIELLDRVADLKPEYAKIWYLKGVVLKNSGKLSDAVNAYDRCLELEPEYPEAWFRKGEVYHIMGRREEEITAYDRAISAKPNFPEAWAAKGVALDHMGKLEEAISACDKAIELRPDDGVPWNNKGAALRDLGRFQEALQSYEKALEIDPKMSGSLFGKALSLYGLGRLQELDETFLEADRTGIDLVETCLSIASYLHRSGRFEQETRVYEMVLRVKPDYAEVWFRRSSALESLERYETALSAVDQ